MGYRRGETAAAALVVARIPAMYSQDELGRDFLRARPRTPQRGGWDLDATTGQRYHSPHYERRRDRVIDEELQACQGDELDSSLST